MKPVFPKLLAAKVETSPYPHFVVDDVFDSDYLDRIDLNWPAHSAFHVTEFGSNYTFEFFDRMSLLSWPKRAFWTSFLRDVYAQVVYGTFAVFGQVFVERFGGELTQVLFGGMMLMEADKEFHDWGIVEPHAHHYHDPLWMFTTLIYLDGEESTGTCLYGWQAGMESQDLGHKAYVASRTKEWHNMPELVPVRTIESKPNRVLSLLDGPLSFHSAMPSNTIRKMSRQRGRRIIRIHVGATPEHAERIYGVPLDHYRELRREPNSDSAVLDWLKKDIEVLYRKRDFAVTPEVLQYLSRIDFVDLPKRELLPAECRRGGWLGYLHSIPIMHKVLTLPHRVYLKVRELIVVKVLLLVVVNIWVPTRQMLRDLREKFFSGAG